MDVKVVFTSNVLSGKGSKVDFVEADQNVNELSFPGPENAQKSVVDSHDLIRIPNLPKPHDERQDEQHRTHDL